MPCSPMPRLGMINVHASLLPRYRGAAPVHRAVIAGERETGVTIMRVVKALDAGPMLATVRRPIGADETSEDVEQRSRAARRRRCWSTTVDRIAGGGASEDAAGRCAMRPMRHGLTKDDGLDRLGAAGASDLHNLVRGLHPWPHAVDVPGRQAADRPAFRRCRGEPAGGPHGTIVAAQGDELDVATGDGHPPHRRDSGRGQAADGACGTFWRAIRRDRVARCRAAP